MHSLSPSPHLPKTNIVEDDQEQLNLDRVHLANIRQNRVSKWIGGGT